MDTVLDRLERSIEENIELENDLGMDVESLGIKELQNRYELFDNIKNEAFRLDNEHELTEKQKERIDKIKEEFEIKDKIDIQSSQKLASFLWEKFGTSVSFESKNIIYYGAPGTGYVK